MTPGMGLFVQHRLQATLHHHPTAEVSHKCPVETCTVMFNGNVRRVLEAYREHVIEKHIELLEECGCCGQFHFWTFIGDCREDWERF